MRATLMLCDYAAVADGKLYISGGGWSVTGPEPSPSAVAIKIDVPWTQANDRIHLQLRLLGEDGHAVVAQTPVGELPVEVQGEFEVGRPPGLKHGTPIDVPMAFPFGPLPILPGKRYSWELRLNGDTQPDWHLAFTTRELPESPPGIYTVDPAAEA
ncbi:hypothetical protein GGQ22_19120 [Nocardioides sp. zg-579]|uniref:Uncharacterized protein n=1 Tax=Nocardioides marmotae TaxID=2663857 RepID=A0A6I3JGN1_9ACTN|nr:hypothetical protein [Nocardioides marmotae]MCR6033527.1 hypothetical protein [Gordonia jinghuaiqii]MTB97185.1 hypothetical protein [Nocardioides marmotae]QKE02104.1 hypothetical protein HPC71_14240 [Nocardioides marmotae]